jgi:hypothetical protein
MRHVRSQLDALTADTKVCFPLSDEQAADLRASSQGRRSRIIGFEEAALAEIAKIVV